MQKLGLAEYAGRRSSCTSYIPNCSSPFGEMTVVALATHRFVVSFASTLFGVEAPNVGGYHILSRLYVPDVRAK